MPPPAVEHTQPAAVARWWRAYAVAMAGFVLIAVFQAAVGTRPGGPTKALFLAALALQLGCIVWILVLCVRFCRIMRALRTRPLPCLHCLYPLALDQPICPECGRLQNRHALSDPWKKRLHI
jgi:hypothetical protein